MSYQQQHPQQAHQMHQMAELKDEPLWNSPVHPADSGFTSHRTPAISAGVRTPALSTYDDDQIHNGMSGFDNGNNWDPSMQQMQQQQQQTGSMPVSHMSTPYYQEPIDDCMAEPVMTELTPQNQPQNTHVDSPYNNAKRHIPELIRLLQDDDPVVVGQAAIMVNQLAKNSASIDAIIEAPALIAELFRTMSQNSDMNTVTMAIGVVNSLSKDKNGAEAVLASGGIHTLLDILSAPLEVHFSYAVTSIHHILLSCKEKSCKIIIQADGITKLVSLFRRPNQQVKQLAIVIDCLQILTYSNPDAKLQVLHTGGTEAVLRIVQTYDSEKLLWNAVRLLKVLGVCSKNKLVIVRAGGVEALSVHLTNKSDRLATNCIWAIRNISDVATKEESLSQLSTRNLIYALNASNDTMVNSSADCLSNLTCNNLANKSMICSEGGLEALINVVSRYAHKNEILEPAICALRHLTSGQAGQAAAQNSHLRNYGLPAVINLLDPERKWPVVNAIIGLLRNLALCEANRVSLRERGALQPLVMFLKKAVHEAQEGRAVIEQTRMEDIMIGTVGTLLTLADDPNNRALIRGLSVVPTLVPLLYSNCISANNTLLVQSISVGVLYKLANDRDGVLMISQCSGAIPALRQLLGSPNDGIKNYASNVLEALSKLQHHQNHQNQQNHQNHQNSYPGNFTEMNNSQNVYRNMDHQNHWNGTGNGNIAMEEMVYDDSFMDF